MAIGFDIPRVPGEAKRSIGDLDEKEVIVGVGLQSEHFHTEIFDGPEAGGSRARRPSDRGGAWRACILKAAVTSPSAAVGVSVSPTIPGGRGQAEAFSSLAFPPGWLVTYCCSSCFHDGFLLLAGDGLSPARPRAPPRRILVLSAGKKERLRRWLGRRDQKAFAGVVPVPLWGPKPFAKYCHGQCGPTPPPCLSSELLGNSRSVFLPVPVLMHRKTQRADPCRELFAVAEALYATLLAPIPHGPVDCQTPSTTHPTATASAEHGQEKPLGPYVRSREITDERGGFTMATGTSDQLHRGEALFPACSDASRRQPEDTTREPHDRKEDKSRRTEASYSVGRETEREFAKELGAQAWWRSWATLP